MQETSYLTSYPLQYTFLLLALHSQFPLFETQLVSRHSIRVVVSFFTASTDSKWEWNLRGLGLKRGVGWCPKTLVCLSIQNCSPREQTHHRVQSHCTSTPSSKTSASSIYHFCDRYRCLFSQNGCFRCPKLLVLCLPVAFAFQICTFWCFYTKVIKTHNLLSFCTSRNFWKWSLFDVISFTDSANKTEPLASHRLVTYILAAQSVSESCRFTVSIILCLWWSKQQQPVSVSLTYSLTYLYFLCKFLTKFYFGDNIL